MRCRAIVASASLVSTFAAAGPGEVLRFFELRATALVDPGLPPPLLLTPGRFLQLGTRRAGVRAPFFGDDILSFYLEDQQKKIHGFILPRTYMGEGRGRPPGIAGAGYRNVTRAMIYAVAQCLGHESVLE